MGSLPKLEKSSNASLICTKYFLGFFKDNLKDTLFLEGVVESMSECPVKMIGFPKTRYASVLCMSFFVIWEVFLYLNNVFEKQD